MALCGDYLACRSGNVPIGATIALRARLAMAFIWRTLCCLIAQHPSQPLEYLFLAFFARPGVLFQRLALPLFIFSGLIIGGLS